MSLLEQQLVIKPFHSTREKKSRCKLFYILIKILSFKNLLSTVVVNFTQT